MTRRKVGIDELEGRWLDYVIAGEVCGLDTTVTWLPGGYGANLAVGSDKKKGFSPSTQWSDAGPLIVRYSISLNYDESAGWTASVAEGASYTHPLPLIAAMRALALSKVTDGFMVPTYN